ncbi:MAG: hypothetical protein K2Q06_08040 [Parvularculaceae bacterium]|nr:hypothetical protein [Parvularculaceae bacterium]
MSDVLTAEIVEEMRALNPGFAYAEIADVGHAPTLDEPQARAAIEGLIARAA